MFLEMISRIAPGSGGGARARGERGPVDVLRLTEGLTNSGPRWPDRKTWMGSRCVCVCVCVSDTHQRGCVQSVSGQGAEHPHRTLLTLNTSCLSTEILLSCHHRTAFAKRGQCHYYLLRNGSNTQL